MFTRKQTWALWLASLGLVIVPIPVLARGGGAAGTGGAASAGGSGGIHPSRMEHVSSEKIMPRAHAPIMASAGSVEGAPAPATQPTQKVSVDNFSFEPKMLTVPVGTKVTWTNRDDVPHTVTSTDHTFSSKAIDTDDQFSYVFTKAGTYTYFCALHPHMKATVIVK